MNISFSFPLRKYLGGRLLVVVVKLLSCISLFATLWTVSCKTPLSMEFSRQEYLWGQEKKGTTEDEVAGGHHRLDAHEFG